MELNPKASVKFILNLVFISQLKCLVLTEKSIFGYKLCLSLNISDQPPSNKSHQPTPKNWDPIKPPIPPLNPTTSQQKGGIVCIGVSTPLKNNNPLFLAKPPLNRQTELNS